MDQSEVLEIFKQSEALLSGHFILSSGRRSRVFLQKSKVFQYPQHTETLCKALADKIKAANLGHIDAIISPAVGGIIPGYETARHMNLPAMYVEREDGVFTLRRGFELPEGARIIVVEDIVSTGLSIRECIASLHNNKIDVLAAACLIDRSAGASQVGVPLISLIEYYVESFDPNDLPDDLQKIQAIKPGSRGLK